MKTDQELESLDPPDHRSMNKTAVAARAGAAAAMIETRPAETEHVPARWFRFMPKPRSHDQTAMVAKSRWTQYTARAKHRFYSEKWFFDAMVQAKDEVKSDPDSEESPSCEIIEDTAHVRMASPVR